MIAPLRHRRQVRWRAEYFVMNGRTKQPRGNILVLGDVTLDWLEQTIPRTEQRGAGNLRNFELYNPGFQWNAVWGGAALLQRLTAAALQQLHKRAEGADTWQSGALEIVKMKLPGTNSPKARRYVSSLALIKPMPSDDKKNKESDEPIPIRVERFLGFDGPTIYPKGSVLPAVGIVPTPQTVGKLNCLLIDDAANSCRWNDDFIDGAMAHAENAAYVIIKLSRPLHKSKLLDRLLSTSKDKLVVIIGADDLRAEGIDLSRRLSWERTAGNLLSAIGKGEILPKLTGVRALLIRLGSDGCVVLTKTARELVFDPKGVEDDFDHDLNGTMPGSTSAFVASVTARLARGETKLTDIVCHSLAASRDLLTTGFVDRSPEKKSESDADAKPGKTKTPSHLPLRRPDYPPDIFADKYEQADVFKTKSLPEASQKEDFSILIEHLAGDPMLPQKIVCDGYGALENIPTAKYGDLLLVDRREIEGYRSIENLLREYIKTSELGQQKPLSIAVFGPPGSGKSFGIKQLAKHVNAKHIKIHTFNLTQMQEPNDLVGAFHIARDEVLRGHLPLLIFDEFDCSFDGRWGWLKYFLAPMQDATFTDGELVHPLGSGIFVFAGGTSEAYKGFNLRDPEKNDSANSDGGPPMTAKEKEKAKKDFPEFKAAKGPDFISRLKGYVDVQGISGIKKDRARVVRRAVLLRSLLEADKRTENLFRMIGKKKGELQIDESVVRAFLDVKKYHHGARSLEAILGMSRLTNADRFAAASLPSDEQLMLHVDPSFVKELKTVPKQTPSPT